MNCGPSGNAVRLEKISNSVLIIACGALAREILALKELNGLDHISLHCLPAELHNRPELIAGAVQNVIASARSNYDHIAVAYAECGTRGALDKVLQEENIERISGPHCYAFFSGVDNFERYEKDDLGAFYLTDFLARHFQKLVYNALGLDRHPELIQEYFRNYSHLVYLTQSNDCFLMKQAKHAAGLLGLEFKTRHTGYGDLEKFVSNL